MGQKNRQVLSGIIRALKYTKKTSLINFFFRILELDEYKITVPHNSKQDFSIMELTNNKTLVWNKFTIDQYVFALTLLFIYYCGDFYWLYIYTLIHSSIKIHIFYIYTKKNYFNTKSNNYLEIMHH